MQILILTGELHEGFQHRRYGCRFVVIGNKGLPRRGDLWQRYIWLRKKEMFYGSSNGNIYTMWSSRTVDSKSPCAVVNVVI